MNESPPFVEEIIEECQSQIDHPPKVYGKDDRYIPMFSKVFAELIEENQHVAQVLHNAVEAKRASQPFTANFAFNSILRLFQMDKIDSEDYPYKDINQWRKNVFDYFNDTSRLKKLSLDMQIWNVGSDVETRVAGPKLVAQCLHPNKVDGSKEGYRILNVGSARDHALAMIAANVALDNIVVFNEDDQEKQEENLQEKVNELINKQIVIGDSYGIDLWPLKDYEWSKFLRACRYYPSELKDETKRQRYLLLEEIRDRDNRLHHVDADFGYIDEEASFHNGYLEGMKKNNVYNMILFSTSLYQNYPEKRRKMIDSARRLLKTGGIIVVQDFCQEEGGSLSHPIDRLRFIGPSSKPYTYSTYVLEKDSSEFEKFASWNNGRCEAVKLSDSALSRIMN